jgi:mannose-6-phosphate isomerase-like protein (cupin superfamily)
MKRTSSIRPMTRPRGAAKLINVDRLTDIARGTSEAWFVEQLATLACAEAAEGHVAMVERTAPAGSMSPLHRRDVAETYRVLAGEVTFFIEDDVVPARPGDVVVAPAGAARTFRAETDARWLVLTHVGSLERFVDFGRALSAPIACPAAGWPVPAECARLASIAAPNGIDLLGPPGALPAEPVVAAR